MPELFSISKLEEANLKMIALLNKPRQQIISIIRSNDNKIAVNKIVSTAKLAQSTVSSHLKVLLSLQKAGKPHIAIQQKIKNKKQPHFNATFRRKILFTSAHP
jgi:predicted transcriptional regulator